MSSLGSALRAAVEPDSKDLNVSEVVTQAGGTSATARILTNVPAGARLPVKGTPERKSYNAAMRRVQRWTTSARERRNIAPRDLAKLRKMADTAGLRKRLDYLDANGGWIRLRAGVAKQSGGKNVTYQTRWLPAYGKKHMTPGAMKVWTPAAREGRWETAAALFLTEFSSGRVLAFEELPSLIGEVEQVEITHGLAGTGLFA